MWAFTGSALLEVPVVVDLWKELEVSVGWRAAKILDPDSSVATPTYINVICRGSHLGRVDGRNH